MSLKVTYFILQLKLPWTYLSIRYETVRGLFNSKSIQKYSTTSIEIRITQWNLSYSQNIIIIMKPIPGCLQRWVDTFIVTLYSPNINGRHLSAVRAVEEDYQWWKFPPVTCTYNAPHVRVPLSIVGSANHAWQLDSFTVPLHSPYGRHLPFGQCKGTVTGFWIWKAAGIPTGHP